MYRRNTGSPPVNVEELKKLIITKRVVLSLRQEVIIRLLLERPDIGAFGTTRSIGAACHVSASTVVRAAQCFGFSDFQGLKCLFQDHLRERYRSAA